MTEFSLFWGGDAIGDCGPYDDDQFSDFFTELLLTNRAVQGVLRNRLNELATTNPAGVTIRMASGSAVVDGKLYRNTDNIDFSVSVPMAGTYYYSLFIKKAFAAQTVRAELSAPSDMAYPIPTQVDGATWDILIYHISVTSGGVITVTDARTFCNFSTIISPDHLDENAFPYSVVGDMAYLSASQILSRVPVGSEGDIMGISGGIPAFVPISGVSLTRSIPMSIPNNVVTVIDSFDFEGFDYGSYHAGTDEFITIPATGVYSIIVRGYFSGHATVGKLREIGIRRNAAVIISQSTAQDTDSSAVWVNAALNLLCTVGDLITMYAVQKSGVAVNFNLAGMQVCRIR